MPSSEEETRRHIKNRLALRHFTKWLVLARFISTDISFYPQVKRLFHFGLFFCFFSFLFCYTVFLVSLKNFSCMIMSISCSPFKIYVFKISFEFFCSIPFGSFFSLPYNSFLLFFLSLFFSSSYLFSFLLFSFL